MNNAITRSHPENRFYNPPAIRRQLQQQQQQQQVLQRQLQRPSQEENRVDVAEGEVRTDSDEPTLSGHNSVRSVSPSKDSDLTNLDRLMESVTPFVPAKLSREKVQDQKTREADAPFFCLGDLWESYKEWSFYGVGVPLFLNGGESIKQYYVPFLSGIQLYADAHRLRRGEDGDTESSRETSSADSSDREAEKQAKGGSDGAWVQHNVNLNSQRLQIMAWRDKPPKNSHSDGSETCCSPGSLVFEYLEQEQPHQRRPLYDKVSNIASQFPDINLYRSCDLLPSSWVSVAWYPIYRIPVGPTLQNLDASFLTFHSLSTNSRSKNHAPFDAPSGRMSYGISSTKLALPAFGLASYKLSSSILNQSEAHEWQQVCSLLQAADSWLHGLGVNLPDFQFFVSHSPHGR